MNELWHPHIKLVPYPKSGRSFFRVLYKNRETGEIRTADDVPIRKRHPEWRRAVVDVCFRNPPILLADT